MCCIHWNVLFRLKKSCDNVVTAHWKQLHQFGLTILTRIVDISPYQSQTLSCGLLYIFRSQNLTILTRIEAISTWQSQLQIDLLYLFGKKCKLHARTGAFTGNHTRTRNRSPGCTRPRRRCRRHLGSCSRSTVQLQKCNDLNKEHLMYRDGLKSGPQVA